MKFRVEDILVGVFFFFRSLIGLIVRPYETYRRIVNKGTLWELLPIALLLACYFAISSLVHTAAFRPFLLTKQFFILAGAVSASFFIVSGTLYIIGKLFNGQGTYRQMMIGWGYTLLPTVCWFLVTSLLYVILPPPRTTALTGFAFSLVFIVFSSALLFWKIMLSYLTLRFVLKIDLIKILGIIVIAGPLISLYSLGMYKMGIFRIPFI